jgi:hypothetical protein
MRLSWCDKIAVIWGGILLLIMAAAWKGPQFMLSDWGVWYILWLVVGIPWLILRLVDLVTGGPGRRRGIITARIIR